MIFVVSGPSGVGKGTLVERLVRVDPGIERAISCTSRDKRPGEVNGINYHFVSKSEFVLMAERGEFVEWAPVHGNLYGTPKNYLRDPKRDVVLEIDCQGAAKIREECPAAQLIFILPPSREELERRLRSRGREKSEADIARRLRNAADEMVQVSTFNWWILNDNLDSASYQLAYLVFFIKHFRTGHPSFQDPGIVEQVQATFALSV